MASRAQRKSTGTRRGRSAARDLTRIEVEAPKGDTALLRAVAKTLRGEPRKARALRAALEEALVSPEIRTAFDVFGTDLPDEVFTGVFDQPRQQGWREVDL
jgi:hypothetical protein